MDDDAGASVAAAAAAAVSAANSLKRKRSLSGADIAHEQQQQQQQGQQQSPLANTATDDSGSKPYHNRGRASASAQHSRHGHLQINYLVRQFGNYLPVASYDDTCPNIIGLLNEYNAVFDRHESIASNLGASSTGSDWARRFERMFDAPPRIVSHPPNCQPNVTWLDVVSFASAYPDHFTLSPENHVPRVCELRIKDCDVLISEHDFEAIKSGGLRNMIPSQPVPEDEERELGALHILEKSINEVVHFADQVALRARVFVRRLGERKAAIVERRSDHLNSHHAAAADTAANTDSALATSTRPAASDPAIVSQEIHDELLRIFNRVAAQRMQPVFRKQHRPQFTGDAETAARSGHVPVTLLDHFESVPLYAAMPKVHRRRVPDGPYRAEIDARTDLMQRGERIFPPCDRCRRLRIDCLKNLTACAGCTKKHAKCSWRDVKHEELRAPPPPPLGVGPDVPLTPNADSVRASQRSTFRHDQDVRHDDLGSYAPAASTPAPQGSHEHHPHHPHHPQHRNIGYEPAFNPTFENVNVGGGGSTVTQQQREQRLNSQGHDEEEARLVAAAAAAHDDQARVHEAARSLAMEAVRNETANLAVPAAALAAAEEASVSAEATGDNNNNDNSNNNQADSAADSMDRASS